MAPNCVTYITVVDTSSLTFTYSFGYGNYLPRRIEETKKQRIARIAKEKMLASHKTFNQKTPTVKHIKQVCRPAHRIGAFRR